MKSKKAFTMGQYLKNKDFFLPNIPFENVGGDIMNSAVYFLLKVAPWWVSNNIP
jgi:hypothetical protein